MSLFGRKSARLERTLSSLRHRDFRLLFFGTSVGTPNAVAISGVCCALAASVLLYQQRLARKDYKAGEALNQRVAE